MQLWKLALSLALLTGAAPFTAAQSPAVPDAEPVEQTPTPAPVSSNPIALPNPTIIPGKWDIKYAWKGTTTDIWTFSDGAVWTRPTTYNDAPAAWNNITAKLTDGGMLALPPVGDPNPYPGTQGATCTGVSRDITATVTVTCTWVPADPAALGAVGSQLAVAPKTLNLLEQSLAVASDDDSFTSSPSADNGMGDPAITYLAHWLGIDLDSGWNEQTNKPIGHLVTHQVMGGVVTFDHSMHASNKIALATGIMGVNSIGGAVYRSHISVSYAAAQDPRAAIITCLAVENPANYHKEADHNTDFHGHQIPNIRSADGHMTVDTAAYPFDGMWQVWQWESEQKLYLASSGFDFSRNFFTRNLTNTTVEWNFDAPARSGGFSEYYQGDINDSSVFQDIYATILSRGQDSDIRTGPVVVSVNVTVEDVRAGMEATAVNKYTIRIHSPLENAHEIVSKRVFDHDEEFPWSDQVGADANDATVLLQVRSILSWVRDDAGEAGLWISGVAGSGAAALIPTFPEGLPLMAADMICNAVGIGLIKYGTPDPAANTTAKADFAAFSQAVADEMKIDNNKATDDNMVCRSEHRVIFDDTLTPTIAADRDLLYQYWLHSVNALARCHAGVRMQRCTVGGDQYNVNGYVGYHEGTTLGKGVSFLVWEFTMTGQAHL